MRARTIAVIAVSAGVAAAAVTGVTYANAVPETPPRSAPAVHEAVHEAAPASAPLGGDANDSYGYNRDNTRDDDGRIQINERSYLADPASCIAVVNVANPIAGATSFNIRNNSRRTVQFFSGITCDAGAPVAVVGPGSTNNAVPGLITPAFDALPGGIIVGSFRVV
ncbi:hypothetical protein ABZ490_44740 [Streptomyces sp. NPDC005811]|uniref:hypothetical protein n=1 Tax=Streptomyces sp. NPDC005811 TaxID=3154565 RepID=UPI0033F8F39D